MRGPNEIPGKRPVASLRSTSWPVASLALVALSCSGGAAPGAACKTAGDCRAGLVCVLISGAGVCQAPGSSCASGAACGTNEVCVDGACVPAPDAGIPDAGGSGSPDAGLGVADGGADAGSVDAGLDAGPSDAGLGDAGNDAGLADGGSSDAGLDAGGEDAGADAGTSDAG